MNKGGEKLIKKGVSKGTEKLFEKIFKEKAPKGLGSMVYAHFDAPRKALAGDAKGAVNSAASGFGALAGGIIGGPIGAAFGYVAAKGPGTVIDFYDTSKLVHTITITNYSKYFVEIEQVPD